MLGREVLRQLRSSSLLSSLCKKEACCTIIGLYRICLSVSLYIYKYVSVFRNYNLKDRIGCSKAIYHISRFIYNYEGSWHSLRCDGVIGTDF